MGRVVPWPPALPPKTWRILLDLCNPEHQEAWARFEAEQEYEAWHSGEAYEKTALERLRVLEGPPLKVISLL